MTDQPADPGDFVARPNDWDTACSAAYLRLLGATQKQAAEGAGCSVRSIGVWETCSWWADALAEARQRWLRGGDAAAMTGIMKALKDDREYAAMSKYWADRRIPELAPPSHKVDATVGGPAGGPLEITVAFVKAGNGDAD
jgi:hypothetical protein